MTASSPFSGYEYQFPSFKVTLTVDEYGTVVVPLAKVPVALMPVWGACRALGQKMFARELSSYWRIWSREGTHHRRIELAHELLGVSIRDGIRPFIRQLPVDFGGGFGAKAE